MCAVANKASRDTARRHQAEAGQYSASGPQPFGFERDGTTIRPAEAAEIVQAADALLAGSPSRSTTPACPRPAT
jgi:site-specific DNA recombinase